MTFKRDDVVMHKKMATLGIVIGAGITMGGQVVYICEIPDGGREFHFFLGTEETLIEYKIDNKRVSRGFSLQGLVTYLVE